MRLAVGHQRCRVVGIGTGAGEDAGQYGGAGGVHVDEAVDDRIPDLIFDPGEILGADSALIVELQNARVGCAATTDGHARILQRGPQLRGVGHQRARRAIRGGGGLVAVNGDVFQNSRVPSSILVVSGRGHVAVVLIWVENPVEIHVVAVENVQIRPVHQAQFVHGFEGRVLAQVRRIEPNISVRLRPAGGVAVGAAAPGNDIGGQVRCHAGQCQKHVGRGGVEIQLRCLIDQPEMRGRGRVLFIAASDQPKGRLPHRDGGEPVGVRVGQCSGLLGVRQDVAHITRRAGDGLFRFHAGDTIVRGTHLERHGVREIQRQAHQPECDPNHNDQHRTALTPRRKRVVCQSQEPEPHPTFGALLPSDGGCI